MFLIVVIIKIENGILKDAPGLKCDLGLYSVPSDTMTFIELKESDLGFNYKFLILVGILIALIIIFQKYLYL